MKRVLWCLFLIVGLLCFLPAAAIAVEKEDVWEEQSKLFEVDKVENMGREYVDEVEIDQNLNINAIFKTMAEQAKTSARGGELRKHCSRKRYSSNGYAVSCCFLIGIVGFFDSP